MRLRWRAENCHALSVLMKTEFQLYLRIAEDDGILEDFKLEFFLPPPPKGSRFKHANMGILGTQYWLVDSLVEVRQIVELDIMRYTTVLYLEECDDGDRRSF